MTPTTAHDHPGIASNRVCLDCRAVLVREGVDFDASVRALSSDVFVHWVPCDTLDVMRVICDFADAARVGDGKYACGVVCAARYDVFAGGRPCEVVNLATGDPVG
jgi:hypothetical protein